MRSTHGLFITIVAAVIVTGAISVAANMGPVDALIGSGAAAPKSSHKSIRLDSEEVTIHLREGSYTVDVVFHFFNTGETTTEWTGFPKRSITQGLAQSRVNFRRFNTWANGQEIAYSEERDWGGFS
jgi:hypothetical protein